MVPFDTSRLNVSRSQNSVGCGLFLATAAWQYQVDYALEIGVCRGYTAQCIAAGMVEGGTLVLCDKDRHALDEGESAVREIGRTDIRIVCVHGDSREVDLDGGVPEIRRGTGGYGLVHVDGCHSYEAAYSDAVKSAKHLREGGVMVFHDYAWGQPGVMQAADRFASETKRSLIAFPERVWRRSGLDSYGFAVIR